MADENAALAGAPPNANGEPRAAWTAVQWRAHEAAIRAAAADALVELVDEVTRSLLAGAPPDGVANEAAVGCINAIIDALHARPSGDVPLRAAVTGALHTMLKMEVLHANTAFYRAVANAFVSMLGQYSLDEAEQVKYACHALDSHFRARVPGASDGEPQQRLVTGGLAKTAAAALARACVRYISLPEVSNISIGTLDLLLKEVGDDKAAVRRAALDAAPSLPRVLLSALTSYAEAQSNDCFTAIHRCVLLEKLGADAEVAALLRAEPGAANGEATSLRAAVRACRAYAGNFPGSSLNVLVTAEVLVVMFAGTRAELAADYTRMFRAFVRSGLVEFQVELLILRGSGDAKVFSHVLHALRALVLSETDSIARKAATQSAVNAAFAALRAHAATLDAAAATNLSSYLRSAAYRFGRRPNGNEETPAALASAFVPLLRAHLGDCDACIAVVCAMQTVSDIDNAPCGSVAILRSCVPVLLEAMRRHAAVPRVTAHFSVMLSVVVAVSFGILGSPLVPSELGDLRVLVASLTAAVRAGVDAASSPVPADSEAGVTAQDRVVSVTRLMRALADAVVPFQDEVARDPAMLAVLAAALRLRPGERFVVQNVASVLRSALRIDESGSRAQKAALVALLRSKRLGVAFCAATEARGQSHCELVLALVAFFTRNGLHVDSSRGATPRAARTCDACGAVETQELAAAGSTKHKMCGRCLKVSYCSIACQHAEWPAHKVTCRAAEQS
jgi:hypothetical protein